MTVVYTMQSRERMLRGLMRERDEAMTASQCLEKAAYFDGLAEEERSKSGVSVALTAMKAGSYESRARHYRRLAEMKGTAHANLDK